MFGFLRVDDLPRFAISMLLGLAQLVLLGFLLERFFPQGGEAAAAVGGAGLLLILVISFWFGTKIWNWICDRFGLY